MRMNQASRSPLNPQRWLLAVASLSLLALGACSQSQPAQPDAPPPAAPATAAPATVASAPAGSSAASGKEHLIGMGTASVLTVHGKIVSVDREKKQVTLEGPGGKQITIHVYDPYNLAAAKPGLPFVARFYEVTTVRRLQVGELLPAVSLEEGIMMAQSGQPGAAVGRKLQVVATIDAIDTDDNTVTLKGPDGVLDTVDVANPQVLQQVKVGEPIVITLIDTVAIALQKESAS